MKEKTKRGQPQPGCRSCLGIGIMTITLCLFLLLRTCVSRVEVMRATSPDGKLIAKVMEINAGATTDVSYEIDVARNQPIRWYHAVAGLHGASRSECAYGVNIHWADNNILKITYKDAKNTDIDQFAHLWGHDIRIIAKSGIEDPSAPCGGMEYGQQGKVVIVR